MASCETEQPWLRAKSAMGWLVPGVDGVAALATLWAALPPMGYQGRKAILCCSQNFRVASAARLIMLYLFWTLTMGTIFWADSIWAGVTSERPMWRNFALLLRVAKGAEGVFEGDGRVDAVELVEVDAVHAEVAEGELELLLEVVGAAAGVGLGWALAGKAAFGCDDQVGGVGVEGFGDELLGDLWAVGVGGVEEVDA